MTPLDFISDTNLLLQALWVLIIITIVVKLILPNLGDLKSLKRKSRNIHHHREGHLHKEPLIKKTSTASMSLIKFAVVLSIGVIGIIVAMEYGVI